MYRYDVKIEILRSGNVYYLYDISNDKELNQNYYSNIIQKLSFYEEENIKNCFDYIITIKKTDITDIINYVNTCKE